MKTQTTQAKASPKVTTAGVKTPVGTSIGGKGKKQEVINKSCDLDEYISIMWLCGYFILFYFFFFSPF
jgi:hypothetical protein